MKLGVWKRCAPVLQGEDIVYSAWKHAGLMGFKSMINIFLARERFSYNIPSLDKLLQTKAIPDSFLEFDEQILVILKAAGIPGPEAYATTKAIKKKKTEKVLAEKEKFKTGFTKVLQETEGVSEAKSHEVVEEIWTIIENAANYMFQQRNLHTVTYVEEHSEPVNAGCRKCG